MLLQTKRGIVEIRKQIRRTFIMQVINIYEHVYSKLVQKETDKIVEKHIT